MEKEMDLNIKLPIEKRAKPDWTIRIALEEMKEYRNWSENTYKGYQRDVDAFEDFSFKEGFDPTLQNIFIHHVDKWIKKSYDEKIAYKTIKRRIASLKSVLKFYQAMGIIQSNPFQAVVLPTGEVGQHSRAMELDEIVDVYKAIQHLKEEEGKDVGVTLRVLFNTGLRGHALASIKVKDVWLDKELIYYDAGIVNDKHVIQFFPIPPRLLEEIKHHIRYYDLQPEDQLLHGLAGLPIRRKQINRLTDRINKVLGWVGAKHVTPHGYRSSIATILDEREMDIDNIKYLLGHSITKENINYYLRRDQRKIRALRSELTSIENEIYSTLEKRRQGEIEDQQVVLEEDTIPSQDEEQKNEQVPLSYFIQLTKTNPALANQLAEMNLVASK
ncbi:tyrosine-type recombinase/integrase [Aquibacillus sediminis]|uniref:tyrosine-type recombinase/integrase n=1 Tax=Aquibacillus sediminis TaxID=2574734 RepID=UPI001108E657|nr:tyrosine-type recombinase/integrase [Aquibacillus sediminis]